MTVEKLIIICAAFAFYIGLLVSIPIRRKKYAAKSENSGKPLPKITPRHIAIMVCGAFTILVLLIRDFGFFVNAVLCGTGLLATNMSVEELCGKAANKTDFENANPENTDEKTEK